MVHLNFKEANMNSMRVWGGGNYESELFYQLADKKGILIWQDAMFACALYPQNGAFLDTVRQEIQEQINRLKHHTSIFIWAGNNENEEAIRGHWWPIYGNFNETQMIADYVKLYRNTIAVQLEKLDFNSRPFVLSSPSNGIETDRAGGVSSHPASRLLGDIHLYDYTSDSWHDSTYPVPRCCSEFGFQSLPNLPTLIDQFGMDVDLNAVNSRQHHRGGNLEMSSMVFAHFSIPNENVGSLETMIFLTQMHQAIAYTVQTEHYRRWRSDIDSSGQGRTMCALYWQLNDIWAAPTWASIDHNLQWKPVHYMARRFFAPIIVSLYIKDDDRLWASVVSDSTESFDNSTVTIHTLAWTNKFTPVFSFESTIDIEPLKATNVQIPQMFANMKPEE